MKRLFQKKEKRTFSKLRFNFDAFLYDHRLSIFTLSIDSGISRSTLHKVKKEKMVTVGLFNRLKEKINNDLEKYIIDK